VAQLSVAHIIRHDRCADVQIVGPHTGRGRDGREEVGGSEAARRRMDGRVGKKRKRFDMYGRVPYIRRMTTAGSPDANARRNGWSCG